MRVVLGDPASFVFERCVGEREGRLLRPATRLLGSRGRRGSALLLTTLLTLTAGLLLGFIVDTVALVASRSRAQSVAGHAAHAVVLEQKRNPSASREWLLGAARSAVRANGVALSEGTGRVELEPGEGGWSVVVEDQAPVFFLRVMRSEPVLVRARAQRVVPASVRA